MRTSDIGSILNSFFENKSYRAILIDGKWGIGKTYQFKKFFDGLHRKERRKVFYFTVFGTETMDELNTRIYRKLHPFWSLIKVGYKTISQSVDAVVGLKNSSLNISANLDYVLDLVEPKKIKSHPVLIFDDIERFDNKHFPLFLGLLYKLNLQGARIICFTSLEKFQGKEALFGEYKEKIFDAVYKIDAPSDDVFDTIFSNLKDHDQRTYILSKCNQNIRILRKTELLFERLVNKFGKPDSWMVDELYVIAACCFVIRIALDSPAGSDGKTFDETNFLYFLLKEKFGKDIAVNYMNLMEQEKFSPTENMIQNLTRNILMVYLFNDYTDLKAMLIRQEAKEETLLEKNFFLLSDDNKKAFVSAFADVIAQPSTKYSKNHLTIFENILRYYPGDIDQDLVDNLVCKFYESTDKNVDIDSSEFIICLEDLKRDELKPDEKKRVDEAITRAKAKLSELQISFHTIKLINAIQEKNEAVINNYIRDFDFLKKRLEERKIQEFLVDNHYCLPDLSGDISESDWHFSHAIAALVHRFGLDEKFICYAQNAVKKDSSNCLKERLEALIQYRLFQHVDLTQQ